MSTYLSLGQGASLVCPPTPIKAKVLRSYVNLPQFTFLLTYLLTYFHRCYLGAKLVYPPNSV